MARISVTTSCTPWCELPELIPAIKQAGYDGVELALKPRDYDPAQPPNCWKNNPAVIDQAEAQDQAAAIHELLVANELACSCVGSYAMTDDIDQIAVGVEAARLLECELLRVRVPWYAGEASYRQLLQETRAAYRDLNQISFETGVDSLIELHDNSICPSASAAMRVLEGLDPTQVGAIYDPGNFLREGHESIPMGIDILGEFLRHVHVKDTAIGKRDTPAKGQGWTGTNVPLGEGDMDWAGIIACLEQRGYNGWYSIENFTGIDRGIDRLADDAAWLRGLLSA